MDISKHYFNRIQYCPICGHKYADNEKKIKKYRFECAECSYVFFQSSKPAVGVIIPKQNNPKNIIITTRSIEPGKGLIDIPGGFLEYNETAEDAAKREVYEELGIEISIEKIKMTDVLEYKYKGYLQSNFNVYVIAKPLLSLPVHLDTTEIESCRFYDLEKILKRPEKFAFSVDYKLLKRYLQKLG